MNYVILAGGSGTRLWPMSRSTSPKQLARLVSDVTMLEDTLERFQGLIGEDNLYISTNEQFAPLIQEILPNVAHDHYIIEPAKRDTGPAMAFCAAFLNRIAPNEPTVFIPSDHYIKNAERYRQTFVIADELVTETGKMVSIGIEPSFANPHLGYLKVGERIEERNGIAIHAFEGQVEKPNQETAQQFLDSGNYLWNANYFCFTPTQFIAAYKTYANEGIGQHLDALQAAIDQNDQPSIASIYDKMEKISIDYAVMEKISHDDVLTIRGDFGWADLGSWDMLYEELSDQADADGNLVKANWHGMETHDTIVYAPEEKVVTTLGVRDLVIIDTPDALLVTTKEKSRDLKKVVELLKERGASHVL